MMNDSDRDNDSADEAASDSVDSSVASEPRTADSADDQGASNGANAGNGASAAAAELHAVEAVEEAEPLPPTLEDQLAAAKQLSATLREKMLRVAADFDNYRKRTARDLEEARNRGKLGAVRELLPVFDNLDRATGHADENTDVTSLLDGLKMVNGQFVSALGKLSIERIDAQAEHFDPNVHESIQHVHSDEHPPGAVITVLQPGYRLGTMLLRPAMVVVSKGPAAPPAAAAADDATSEAAETDAAASDASETEGTEPDATASETAEPDATAAADDSAVDAASEADAVAGDESDGDGASPA